MIYEEFKVMSLEPVKYEIASIAKAKRAKSTGKHSPKVSLLQKHEKGAAGFFSFFKTAGFIDALIRSCIICFIILALLTAVNIAGFNAVMENLKEIVASRSLSGLFALPEFM
jgi:hypothetical protein